MALQRQGSYSDMMAYARKTGQAGHVRAQGGGGRSISYKFTPSGGRSSAVASTAPTGPNVSPEAQAALQAAMARYEPGGGYGKGIEAGLARGRTQAMSSGMQNLVSSGLAGTTIAGGLGKKYEQEVAMPARAQMEEGRATALSSLQVMLAQMEQGGYQAKLGRQFAASESGLSRQFQGGESALGRQFQGNQSALSRQQQRQPQQRQPQQRQPQQQPAAGVNYAPKYTSTIPSSLAPPSESRIPGSYVGSINGQRWIYNEQGIPTRE